MKKNESQHLSPRQTNGVAIGPQRSCGEIQQLRTCPTWQSEIQLVTPWETIFSMENHHVWRENQLIQLYMAIFNSYFSLPEGN